MSSLPFAATAPALRRASGDRCCGLRTPVGSEWLPRKGVTDLVIDADRDRASNRASDLLNSIENGMCM